MIMTNQHCFPSQKYYLQEGQESGECFLLVESYPTTLLLCHVFCSVQTRAVTTGARCTVLILDHAIYSLDNPNSERNCSMFRNFVDLRTIPVAVLFKAWVCDSLIAGIAVWNPADGMDVGLICVSM